MISIFETAFQRSIDIKEKCMSKGFSDLVKMGMGISNALRNGGKLMICDNGGSAADAQHLAAELLVRLRPHVNRSPSTSEI